MGTASWLCTVTAVVLCLSALRLADARKKGSGGGRSSGISKRASKPPPFACAIPNWSQPKPEETAEIDLGDMCDWDMLDEPPTDEVFRNEYWQKKPMLVRNFTARWPAYAKWHKQYLWEEYGGRNVDSFDSDQDHVAHANWKPQKLAEFLKKKVCTEQSLSYTDQMHQEYVFDKDGIFKTVPELLNDYEHPPFIEMFFDPDLHAHFSRYFLIGTSMSGINYHSHTDAYNGLLHGRKRWLVYDNKKMRDPPYRGHGTLRWVREVLPGLSEKEKPLQCMQSSGDLMYVPEGYWHGTVNLGETIGVSGQFVRNTGKWAKLAQAAVGEKDWKTGVKYFKLMLTTPGPHDKDARFNLALCLHYDGDIASMKLVAAGLLSLWGSKTTDTDVLQTSTPERLMEVDTKVGQLMQMSGLTMEDLPTLPKAIGFGEPVVLVGEPAADGKEL